MEKTLVILLFWKTVRTSASKLSINYPFRLKLYELVDILFGNFMIVILKLLKVIFKVVKLYENLFGYSSYYTVITDYNSMVLKQ